MKRRSGLGIALGLLAAITLPTATLAAFTALTNGSFEDGTYNPNASGFEQLNAPNTSSINGWTVDSGSVDWIGAYWTAPDGEMSIDMSGADAGTLSQTFDTTVGNTYTVTFLLSGNPDGEPAVKTLDVSATGATPGSYSHDTTGTTLTTMVWTEETYSFLATSASTTLSFISTTATAFGPAIDRVAVTESVPVKNDCKNGGWQSMIDNQGNSFKNQGDCVSYFATKGKNLGAVPPVTEAASAADAATAADKHSSKHADKVTARQSTERHAPKDKAKSHVKGGHSSKSHKSK